MWNSICHTSRSCSGGGGGGGGVAELEISLNLIGLLS